MTDEAIREQNSEQASRQKLPDKLVVVVVVVTRLQTPESRDKDTQVTGRHAGSPCSATALRHTHTHTHTSVEEDHSQGSTPRGPLAQGTSLPACLLLPNCCARSGTANKWQKAQRRTVSRPLPALRCSFPRSVRSTTCLMPTIQRETNTSNVSFTAFS